MAKKIIAHLMGGLGNQMFQYAAARGIAVRNKVPLYVDDYSGFARDFVYKRTYELSAFPIEAKIAGWKDKLPYIVEKIRAKIAGAPVKPISDHLLWTAIEETSMAFMPEIASCTISRNSWMHGYWQSEQYFSDIADIIARELMPPAPADRKFLEYGDAMRSCNSISVGVRLFEEVPGASKDGVGGLTPMHFFNESIEKMKAIVDNPRFFVFCTTNSPQLNDLSLPADTVYITHDNGFHGTLARLWLYAQCKNHIIANSSFYWWGAWLSEAKNPNAKIIASPMFSNVDTIPARWMPGTL